MCVIIYEKNDVLIEVIQAGPIKTNCGMIAVNGQCVVVDAPPDSTESIETFLAQHQLKLAAVLITHWHWDHCMDAHIWKERGAEVYAHELDAALINHPSEINLEPYFDMKGIEVDHILHGGERFKLIGLALKVLWIPGHSAGDAGYYFPDLGVSFIGDTLFYGTVGRSDFPGGDKHRLFRAIREQLYTLPDDTILIPGHGRITTVGREKEHNLFIRPNHERLRKRD